jgi:hypothetical protein
MDSRGAFTGSRSALPLLGGGGELRSACETASDLDSGSHANVHRDSQTVRER